MDTLAPPMPADAGLVRYLVFSGSLRAGFIPASHAAWWTLMACSGLVLVLGYLATTRRAAESAQHVAAALNPEALIEHTH